MKTTLFVAHFNPKRMISFFCIALLGLCHIECYPTVALLHTSIFNVDLFLRLYLHQAQSVGLYVVVSSSFDWVCPCTHTLTRTQLLPNEKEEIKLIKKRRTNGKTNEIKFT